MPFTEEELNSIFSPPSENVMENECPEGFEKDENTGECIPSDLKIKEQFVPEIINQGPKGSIEDLDVEDYTDEETVTEKLEKVDELVLDKNYINTYKDGEVKLEDFNSLYLNGTITTPLDKIDEKYDLLGFEVDNVFALETLNDENKKEQAKIATEKGQQAFDFLMKGNTTINKDLIPNIARDLDQVFLDEKLRLQAKYSKKDAAKAIEEFEMFYNTKINEALVENPIFKQILKANSDLARDVIEKDAKRIGQEALGITPGKFTFNEFYRSFKSSKLGLRAMGGGVSIEKYEESLTDAEKNNWDDDKIVYMSTQLGGRITPEVNDDGVKQYINTGTNTKTTWGEAKKMLGEKIDEAGESVVDNLMDEAKVKETLQYFPKAEIFDKDGLTWNDFKGITGKQLPQLGLALVGGGLGILIQETGGSYIDNLYAATIKEFDLSEGEEPTKEQLLSVIKKGKDNPELAIATGTINMFLERIGAKTMLKAGKTAAAAVPWASLMRGEVGKVIGGLTSKAVIKNNLLAGLFEAGTEISQTFVSQGSQSFAGGKNYFDIGEVLESGGQGALMGVLLPFGGGIARQTMIEFKNTASIIAGKFDPQAMENYYKQAKSAIEQDEGLSPTDKRERLLALGEIRAQQVKVPSEYSPESKTELIQLLVEQNQIKNKYKDKDQSLIPKPQQERLKQIKEQVQQIATTTALATVISKDIKTTKEFAKQFSLEVKDDLTIEELNDVVKQKGIKGWNAKNDPGIIIDGTIYLNPNVKSFGAKTASHELLHGILRNAIENEQLTLGTIKEFAKTNLNTEQYRKLMGMLETQDSIVNPDFDKNKPESKSNPKRVSVKGSSYKELMVEKTWGKNKGEQVPYLEQNPDEYLTLIYEAGLLKDKTILSKVIDFIKQLFTGTLNKEITLESADDVRKFLQGYQESIKTGKLTNRVSKLGNAGSKTGSAFSKGGSKASDQTVFQSIDKIAPLGTTKDQYSKVNINDAFNATMPGGVISNYISSKSTSPQQFSENIAAIRDRLANFNPVAKRKTKNLEPIKFSEFVVANTNFSKLVANKKLAIDAAKKAQEDRIDDGTLQIANPSSISSSKPEIDKRTTYPDVVIPKNEIGVDFIASTKSNLEILPTDNLKKITYKTSKTIAPQAFADIWGLPLKVITQSNFNLSDVKNIRRVQSWIRDNALNLIKLLPEGNTDVKVSDSKQKNKDGTFKKIKRGGESLALPDNIRDNPVFYNQLFKPDGTPIKIDSETLNAKGKSKSKSNQYRKRPDITRTQFLSAFGVTNNKSDKQFDVRESEAQSIKGLLEIVGRNITNFYAEQELNTRKDISTSEKAVSKVKLRSGKSRYSFAKANIDNTYNDYLISKGYPARVLDALNNNDRDFVFEVLTTILPNYLPVTGEDGKVLIQANKNWANAGVKEDSRKKRGMYFVSAGDTKGKYAGTSVYKKKNILNEALKNEREFPLIILNKGTKNERTVDPRKIVSIALQDKTGMYTRQNNPLVFGSAESNQLVEDNFDGGEYILSQLEKMMEDYPATASFVGAFFNQGSKSTTAFVRQLGIIRGLDTNFIKFERLRTKASNDFKKGLISEKEKDRLLKKYKTEKEHVWQQNLAGELMSIMITTGSVKKWMPYVRENYFMLGITAENNSKLTDTKGDFGPIFNFGSKQTPEFTKALEEAIQKNDPSLALPSLLRYYNKLVNNNNGGFNPNTLKIDGLTNAETYNLQIPFDKINKESIANQQLLIKLILEKEITQEKARQLLEKGLLLDPTIAKTSVVNNNTLPVVAAFSKGAIFTNENVLDKMAKLDNSANKARVSFSKANNLNEDFNDIIERATGIGSEKKYGRSKASVVGQDKGKWDWAGIPPSAQDFVGLTRYFAGKGKKGDKTIAWIKENFLDPFARANIDISNARVALANDYKALKQLLKIGPKDLNVKIKGEPYTVGNAIRVYTWVKQGMKVPGLSKSDEKILIDFVENDPNLVAFSEQLIAINKDNGYPKPGEGWMAGTVTTDLLTGLNTVVRAKYLKQWQNNVNEVFTEENMNKLEAAYGKGYRDALENMLGRMKTGSNRGFKGDTLTGRFVDWLNGSIGAIMFFNMRSAVLQTISAVNFVNWSDNNPLNAAAAFANQPQYWGDVVMLMNSDYLVERRNGLKINVNEADIAEIAAESKNKAKAFIAKLLKLGFLPTQIADSFAIASGGATFYRNRIKSLVKEGMSQKEAEAQAFQDFREIAEESQQSSRPDRISAQQAGPMGRVILAFANTPAQYARLMQKAGSDLKNRRGDDKTNLSKILYYGMIQNVIFNALQQALFAMAFDDEEGSDENKDKKYTNIVNGMADSLLRGVGFHGAAISTLKNVIVKLTQGAKAQDAAIEMLKISPPISSKIGKLRSAGRTWDWNQKEMREKGWSLDNPAWLAGGQVISAGTNIPLDRGIKKLQNLKDASDAENEEWMRVANALGWQKWELEWEKDKVKKKSKKKIKKYIKL
jgi:hypothetical protein